MAKRAVRALAQDIANELVIDLRRRYSRRVRNSAGIVELLLEQLATDPFLQRLARRLVSLTRETSTSMDVSDDELGTRLQKVERRLMRLATDDGDGNENGVQRARNSLPNLKYAKPKYQNVESMLKYIESEDGKSGVKLVIMNFND